MNLSKKLLKMLGWQVGEVHLPPKCVIALAPHTSNWDFVYGILFRSAIGLKTHFTIKKEWFFFPSNYLMRSLGGIPIDRKVHRHLIDQVVEQYNSNDTYYIVIPPEGTRSANPEWHKGFLRIAHLSNVPVATAFIDYKHKSLGISGIYYTTEDIEEDVQTIKNAYSAEQARYPQKFAK